MKIGKRLPPSRENKKQISAHLDPNLVQLIYDTKEKNGTTLQTEIAKAINIVLKDYNVDFIIPEHSDRIVHRTRNLAKIQTVDRVPNCRVGKKRIAAWFFMDSVLSLISFCDKNNFKIEDLVELGFKKRFKIS